MKWPSFAAVGEALLYLVAASIATWSSFAAPSPGVRGFAAGVAGVWFLLAVRALWKGRGRR